MNWDEVLSSEEIARAYEKWRVQKARCMDRKDAAGRIIQFKLTFQQWMDIWWMSGHWFDRGRGKGQFCMTRPHDLGHYEVGNVIIRTCNENHVERNTGVGRASRTRGPRIKAALEKPCTIDGIIYSSQKALIAELGSGKNGARHAAFRYLTPEEVTLWRTQSKKKDVE